MRCCRRTNIFVGAFPSGFVAISFFYEDEAKQDGPYLDTAKVERFIYEGKSLLR